MITAHNERLELVADPIDPQDAVNLRTLHGQPLTRVIQNTTCANPVFVAGDGVQSALSVALPASPPGAVYGVPYLTSLTKTGAVPLAVVQGLQNADTGGVPFLDPGPVPKVDVQWEDPSGAGVAAGVVTANIAVVWFCTSP